MISPQSVRTVLLLQLFTAIGIVSAQPTQVAGTLDTSFNPSGFWITETGASITGGYAGSIIIDLGGRNFGESVATFQAINAGRIVLGGNAQVGPPGSALNFALVMLTETGALESSFNPSGLWITETGASITGGYPGSIIIDLGGNFEVGRVIETFQNNSERIIIGGKTDAGPIGSADNFAVIMLTETGILEGSFNPSGFWITSTGASITGGYPGSIIIDLGGTDEGQSIVSFDSNGKQIIIGGSTTIGPGVPPNFALIALTETGVLDSSFNPSGLWITSTGASIVPPGGLGYPGSIIIDLGGIDIGLSVASFDSSGEQIIIGGPTTEGPGDNPYAFNFALIILTKTGALDNTFNPSGFWITETGASVTGGYPGSIIIDLGGVDIGNSVTTFQADGERIVIGGFTDEGPGTPNNFALVALTQTGALDSSFNPNGYWITETGASITGGYPGSIIIDLGGDEEASSVTTFQSDGQRIVIGGSTNTGPGVPDNFALVVLTKTGALDGSFNPNGYWINSGGISITGGYPGSIIIDLGEEDYGQSIATFQSDKKRIIIGGNTKQGPGSLIDPNFALVVLNSETIFPLPPISPLLALPFVAMAAA